MSDVQLRSGEPPMTARLMRSEADFVRMQRSARAVLGCADVVSP